jgi:hypothetical protein
MFKRYLNGFEKRDNCQTMTLSIISVTHGIQHDKQI